MIITENTKLKELYEYPPLKKAANYLIGCGQPGYHQTIAEDSPRNMYENTPAWYANDLVLGLSRLTAIAEAGIDYLHPVYTEVEIALEQSKSRVQLFYFPAENNENKMPGKYAVLTAGGGYQAVCSMIEAFPVAARLNKMGITAFCVNYRTYVEEDKRKGLMPAPIEDLCAAISYIDNHSQVFGVNPEAYSVWGFSAGGHLAGMWGTAHLGYLAHHFKAPEVLILNYAYISPEPEKENDNEMLFDFLLGTEAPLEIREQYFIDRHVSAGYPPTYLVHCEDDTTVPIHHMERMDKALRAANIPCLINRGKRGGHGYGLGTGTSVNQWVEQAVDFWQKQSKVGKGKV